MPGAAFVAESVLGVMLHAVAAAAAAVAKVAVCTLVLAGLLHAASLLTADSQAGDKLQWKSS